MDNEYVIVVDEHGQDVVENDVVKTVETMEAHRKGIPHRAVSVFLFNSNGALLLQRRAMKKFHSGGLWSNTCCTHIHAGEKPLDTATRRLQEELGVKAQLKEILKFSYWASVAPDLIENEYDHIFFGVSDCAPTANPDEVSDWAWWDVRYLRERIAASPESFTCWLRYSLEQVHDYAKGQKVFSVMPQEIANGVSGSTDSKTCFVICPYDSASGKVDYGERFIQRIVRPVIDDRRLKYQIKYGHKRNYDPNIPLDIDKSLVDSDLVIADLTEANPNVMYELGKRHAVGGHCVQFTAGKPEELPFDVRSQRTIPYDLENLDLVHDAQRALANEIMTAGISQPSTLDVSATKVARSMRHTVICEYGQSDRRHYAIALKLIDGKQDKCTRFFLMQRSSTLILGPRDEWADEKAFYIALLACVKNGAALYHVVDLQGIGRHYRPNLFPEKDAALKKLEVTASGGVQICGTRGVSVLKRVERRTGEQPLLPDRQARAFVAEFYDGHSEGVFVFDLGPSQFFFHIMGSKMSEFLDHSVELYNRLPDLTTNDLQDCFRQSVK